MKKLKKVYICERGFTLVELAVTIVLVIILMTVSVPIYNEHVQKAKITEGYALLASIRSAQENYYIKNGNFLRDINTAALRFTCNEPILGINAITNKYFTYFDINQWELTHSNSDVPGKAFFAVVNSKNSGNLTMIYHVDNGVTII
ncbi:MAG: prepilin-type N-terminal cleavage/methylation domain-containing protein [Elusimicrobia bacterium]|nr:prepilin-type N-terminal cleavage/methylation domain-containing protein [Elusimicrobiota bacterium]